MDLVPQFIKGGIILYNDNYLLNGFYNKYGLLTPEEKIIERVHAHRDLTINMLMAMYKSDLDLNTMNMLERILIVRGYAVIGTFEGEIVVGYPSTVEGFDDNGVPIISGGVTWTGREIENPTLIGNNADYTPDTRIFDRYCYELAKIERSEDKLVEKSVCNPIPFASSEKVADGIRNALKNSGQEDPQVILSTPLSIENMEGKKDFDILNLTDVDYANNFAYLSNFRNNLKSELFFTYGLAYQSPTKLAQTNNPELEDRETASLVYPTERLKMRQNGLKKFREKTGIKIVYEFSDLWQTIDNDSVKDNNVESEEKKGGVKNGDV